MAGPNTSGAIPASARQRTGAAAPGNKPFGGDSNDTPISQLVFQRIDALPPIDEWPTRFLNAFILEPTFAAVNFTVDVVKSPRTHRIFLRVSVLTTLFWTALALAIISYIGFVRVWLPQVGLRKTVWLQYG